MKGHLRRVAPYGDHAWLIEADDCKPVSLAEAIRNFAAHDTTLSTVIDEVVPGARTILVITKSHATPNNFGELVAELLRQVDLGNDERPLSKLIRLAVTYDGADLELCAATLGISAQAVVHMHSEPIYEVAFCGFAPGFAYLTGLNPRLHLPRLSSPRPKVPAGSVAIADAYSSVYPQASPGGWRLLGHTDATLFDLHESEPALLQPGTQVQFVPAGIYAHPQERSARE